MKVITVENFHILTTGHNSGSHTKGQDGWDVNVYEALKKSKTAFKTRTSPDQYTFIVIKDYLYLKNSVGQDTYFYVRYALSKKGKEVFNTTPSELS